MKEVHVWTNRPIWPQGERRPVIKPVPKSLDWEAWLGPARYRPYGDGYHPFSWRGWWDFGTGALGDMACHTCNLPFMALNMRDPVSVEAECPEHDGDSYPEPLEDQVRVPRARRPRAVHALLVRRRQHPAGRVVHRRHAHHQGRRRQRRAAALHKAAA